jgi:hypothetical protein
LDAGTFVLPQAPSENATTVAVEERVLDDLLDGIDIEKRKPHRLPRVRMH